MPDVPAISEVLTWPQAIFGGLVVLAVLVVPQVLSYLTSRQARTTANQVQATLTTNNGGSTVKDQLDRIEGKVDDALERVERLENPETGGAHAE